MVFTVEYSDLCNSDSELYRLYLSTIARIVDAADRGSAAVGGGCGGGFAVNSTRGLFLGNVCETRGVVLGPASSTSGESEVSSRDAFGGSGQGKVVGVSGDYGVSESVGAAEGADARLKSGFGCVVDGGVDLSCEASGGAGDLPVRGVHYERNKARRERDKLRRKEAGNVKAVVTEPLTWSRAVPEWRKDAGACRGFRGSPVTSTRVEVDEELEARKSLAARRVAENKVAEKLAELRLLGLQDKDKTDALAKLDLARIQERINTATAKSQASYKKCDSPLDSVGSAGSAGEFAWKQEIRKRDVIVAERDSLSAQLDKAMPFVSEEGRRVLAAMPTPYLPTDAEIEAMDADISPYPSQEDMEAEANAYFSRADAFFEH